MNDLRLSLRRAPSVALTLLLFAGCGEDEVVPCNPVTLDASPCDPATGEFSLVSTNAYYPLHPGLETVLEGTSEGELIRVERRVLDETEVVAGVTTRVLEARELINGALVELTRNFYVEAAGGIVCYFGEDVTFYEGGVVRDHHGSWRAGVDGASPGVIMPANPTAGQVYYQENAPGVALDMGRVRANDLSDTLVGVPFEDIVSIEDTNPIDDEDACAIDEKRYVPGIGEAKDGDAVLVSYVLAPLTPCSPVTLTGACDPATTTFSLASTNPYYPLIVGSEVVLEGEEDGERVRVERRVLPETEIVAGVTTHVLEARELVDGELYEVARNFYVEAADGTVCYFGEEVTFYEDGEVLSHNGSWRAGVGGATPGVIMPAAPSVGQVYYQENAPGVAHDMGRIVAIDGAQTLGGVAYGGVVTVADTNPLTTCEVEEKLYAPGVGEAGDTLKALVSFTPGGV